MITKKEITKAEYHYTANTVRKEEKEYFGIMEIYSKNNFLGFLKSLISFFYSYEVITKSQK